MIPSPDGAKKSIGPSPQFASKAWIVNISRHNVNVKMS